MNELWLTNSIRLVNPSANLQSVAQDITYITLALGEHSQDLLSKVSDAGTAIRTMRAIGLLRPINADEYGWARPHPIHGMPKIEHGSVMTPKGRRLYQWFVKERVLNPAN